MTAQKPLVRDSAEACVQNKKHGVGTVLGRGWREGGGWGRLPKICTLLESWIALERFERRGGGERGGAGEAEGGKDGGLGPTRRRDVL